MAMASFAAKTSSTLTCLHSLVDSKGIPPIKSASCNAFTFNPLSSQTRLDKGRQIATSRSNALCVSNSLDDHSSESQRNPILTFPIQKFLVPIAAALSLHSIFAPSVLADVRPLTDSERYRAEMQRIIQARLSSTEETVQPVELTEGTAPAVVEEAPEPPVAPDASLELVEIIVIDESGDVTATEPTSNATPEPEASPVVSESITDEKPTVVEIVILEEPAVKEPVIVEEKPKVDEPAVEEKAKLEEPVAVEEKPKVGEPAAVEEQVAPVEGAGASWIVIALLVSPVFAFVALSDPEK